MNHRSKIKAAVFLYYIFSSLQITLGNSVITTTKIIPNTLEPDSTTQESSSVAGNYTLNLTDPSYFEQLESVRKGADANNGSDLVVPQTTASSFNDSEYSEAFLSCPKSMVEKEHVSFLKNGSAYVLEYKLLFYSSDYFLTSTGDIYICSNILKRHRGDNKFSEAFEVVSIVGTALSTVCIVLHIVMFLCFKKLRNLPGYSLFSLCIALLVAYISIYIPHAMEDGADCSSVGVIRAFSFLASFFWMNTMAYDIWRSLRMATAKLRLTGDRSMFTRLAMYSAYSWGVPFSIIMFGLIINSTDADEKYKFTMDGEKCWFLHRQALLIYFAVPLFTLLGVNILFFTSCFIMIHSATMNTAENKADLWSRFLVCVRLAIAMGLMWFFGVLATATEQNWLWYLNVFFSVLQGVFIFFSFTFTEKTRKECRKALMKKKSSVFSKLNAMRHYISFWERKKILSGDRVPANYGE